MLFLVSVRAAPVKRVTFAAAGLAIGGQVVEVIVLRIAFQGSQILHTGHVALVIIGEGLAELFLVQEQIGELRLIQVVLVHELDIDVSIAERNDNRNRSKLPARPFFAPLHAANSQELSDAAGNIGTRKNLHLIAAVAGIIARTAVTPAPTTRNKGVTCITN